VVQQVAAVRKSAGTQRARTVKHDRPLTASHPRFAHLRDNWLGGPKFVLLIIREVFVLVGLYALKQECERERNTTRCNHGAVVSSGR
jgi:hypothetical protein